MYAERISIFPPGFLAPTTEAKEAEAAAAKLRAMPAADVAGDAVGFLGREVAGEFLGTGTGTDDAEPAAEPAR